MLGQRNCKEADTAERRGWCEDGAGFGRKQGRSELPEVLMRGAGEMRTPPDRMSRRETLGQLCIFRSACQWEPRSPRTGGLMLHLEMCLVLDNYNQEGDGYPSKDRQGEMRAASSSRNGFLNLKNPSYLSIIVDSAAPKGVFIHSWGHTATFLSKQPHAALSEWGTCLL